jgi:putative inorganic carbon (HCO3(-)) transporter
MQGLIKVLIYIGTYYWFRAAFAESPSWSYAAFLALLGSGMLVALYGIHQYQIGVEPLATWEDPSVEVKAVRIYSTLGNPNLLAGYLLPLVPLSLSMGMMFLFQRNYFFCFAAFISSCIFAVTTILTGSRGSYIGLFACMLLLMVVVSILAFKAKPIVRNLIIMGLCLLFILLGYALYSVPSFEQRIVSIFAGREHTSNSFRLNVWMASWRMFLDNWWLGIGPGNKTFVQAYGLYMRTGFDALGTYCVPLEVGVETGLLGLISSLGLLGVLFSRAHLVFWKSDHNLSRWLTLGCAASVLGIMAHGMVDTVFFRPQVQFIFWFMVSYIAGTYRGNSKKPS